MTDQSKKKRNGSWDYLETIEDPDSKIGLVLSERMRGKPAFSMQIIHTDDVGLNKHIPMEIPEAKHAFKDIVYSLVARAEEIVAKRKAEWDKKSS